MQSPRQTEPDSAGNSRTLYLLCGGNSTRMGTDKVMLKLNDLTLLEYQIRKVRPYFGEIVLLSAGRMYDSRFRSLPDALPDAGPLGGLLSACSDAGAGRSGSYFAVIAVDIPLLSPSTLRFLASAQPDSATDAVTLKSAQNQQPLAGLYHPRIEPKLRRFLSEGERKVRLFLNQLTCDYHQVTAGELKNINSMEDFNDIPC